LFLDFNRFYSRSEMIALDTLASEVRLDLVMSGKRSKSGGSEENEGPAAKGDSIGRAGSRCDLPSLDD
jgi:hypothetical protein